MAEPISIDLTPSKPLTPADAAAAIICTKNGRYLLQQRDAIPTIFYPGHWGCFGGALEPGETPLEALRRELNEELGLADYEATLFSRFRFSVETAGIPALDRHYYEVVIAESAVDSLRLGEGAAMRLFDGVEALHTLRIVPYDAFALWLHRHQAMLVGKK